METSKCKNGVYYSVAWKGLLLMLLAIVVFGCAETSVRIIDPVSTTTPAQENLAACMRKRDSTCYVVFVKDDHIQVYDERNLLIYESREEEVRKNHVMWAGIIATIAFFIGIKLVISVVNSGG